MARVSIILLALLLLLPSTVEAKRVQVESPSQTEAVDLVAGEAEAPATLEDAVEGAALGEAEGEALGEGEQIEGEAEGWDIQRGPADIELGHDIAFSLPEGYGFIEKVQAIQALEMMGNFGNDEVLGLVVSNDENSTYFVVIEYFDPGWVNDKETLNADDLLKALREGQRQANITRRAKGFEPLQLDGWAEKPYYDRQHHHLVWAITVSDPAGASINYSTRVLGRRGFVSLNLVTEATTLAADKASIQALLTTTKFKAGATYEDFNPDTDHSSGLGIGALIAGGALGAKVGIFAKIGKFLLMIVLVGKKFFILFVVGIGAFFKRIFGGKTVEPSHAEDLDEADRSSFYDFAASDSKPAADAGESGDAGEDEQV